MTFNSKIKIILATLCLPAILLLATGATSVSANTLFSTTYNCPDTTVNFEPGPFCGGIYVRSASNVSGNYTTVTSAANYPGGGGGGGQRHWMGPGDNIHSGGLRMEWSGAQNEIWVRFYLRYQPGFNWNGLIYDKLLYFNDGGSNAAVLELKGGDSVSLWVAATDTECMSSGGSGWASVFSDYQWHSMEVHMRQHTTESPANGVVEIWVDGNRVVNRTDVDFGSTSGRFNGFSIGHNNKYPAQVGYCDFDDVEISNSGYIGPISGGGSSSSSSTTTVPSPANLRVASSTSGGGTSGGGTGASSGTGQLIFEESFDDANLASRGWFDNTNIVTTNSEHAPGSTSSAEFRFLQGATTPTSGGTIRKTFADTDEVYIKYMVKYSANWEGSNQSYHPHEFYFLTNLENDWAGPAYTHLTAYVEQNEGTPMISIQDGMNVDNGNIGVDLTNITENRGVAGCNGDSDGYGAGDCYAIGGNYVNGKSWRANNVYFSDVAGSYYKNDWHQVEAYIKLNSIANGKGVADGIIRYWYDGNLIIDHQNVMIRTAQNATMQFNKVLLGPYIGDGSPVDQTFWIDQLTVGTAPL